MPRHAHTFDSICASGTRSGQSSSPVLHSASPRSGVASAAAAFRRIDRRANAEEFDRLFQQVKNWGRWGADDQLGSVNLITAGEAEAGAVAREDRADRVARAQPADRQGRGQRQSVRAHDESRVSRPTRISVSYHGYSHSHMDALCHILYKDQTYNGYARAVVNTDKGCTKLGIENLKQGLITRGDADRHSAPEGRAVSRARHRDLPGRRRGVGEDGRREDRVRRCDPAAHRTLGAAREGWAVGGRP